MADLTISSLTEQIYQARDLVAAEPTGFMQSVVVNGGSEGVSIGGTANSLRTAEPTLNTSYTPSMTIPDGDAQTLLKETLTIDKVANVRIPLTGEQQKQLDNTVGGDYARLQMFAQAFRKMRNAIEAEGGSVIKNGSSRATGTAGTSPFATNINPLSDLRKILTDNGAPLDDSISLVINTTAGADFRKLTNLYKVNEAGTDRGLRNGELGNIFGFSIKESAGVAAHTKGAGASYVINNGTIAVGSTTISVDGGTVNTTGFKAGDIITIADEPTAGKYVVKTGLTATAGDVIINYPGLTGAIVDGKAVTIGNSYSGNVGFHKAAIELVMRPPAQPYGGDAATDRMTMYDEKSGLSFEIAIYKGYGKVFFDITCFYAWKVWKPEFVATLLG